jgi:hypothetical protein
MLLPLARSHELQAAVQRFIYDLESSAFFGACDETPAHKVWSQLWQDGDGWPTYGWHSEEERPAGVLAKRWQRPPAWCDALDADYEAGTPGAYTPAAWAAFLRMPEGLYRTLVDLVFEGRVETLWGVADGMLHTVGPIEPDAVADHVAQVLALARTLPLVKQLQVIQDLTASMQEQWQAITEEYAARVSPSQDQRR